jgi:protein Xni
MPVFQTKALLIDGFNLIRRIFEAMPADSDVDGLRDSTTKSVQRALNIHKPSHVIVVFEDHDTTWRHLLYPEYKAGRKPTPEPLLKALPSIESGFEMLGVHSISLASYEADDIIATIAHKIAGTGKVVPGGEVIILSTDKSFLQLLRPGIRVFNHFSQQEYLVREVEERHGVSISQLTDYWALVGDGSNNIKGVPKIGKKSAAELLQHYKTLSEIIDSGEDDSKVRKVQEDSVLALRCRQLVTLKLDVELGINLKDYRLNP